MSRIDPEEEVKRPISPYRAAPGQSPTRSMHQNTLQEVVNVIKNANVQLHDVFDAFDKDGDGTISREEFKNAFIGMKLGLKIPEIEAMIREIDTSGNGTISYSEFLALFKKYGYEDRNIVSSQKKKLRTVNEMFQILVEYMSRKSITLLKLFTEYFDKNKDSFIGKEEL
jgi:Ca2+-binding EF-hand superfamily protein